MLEISLVGMEAIIENLQGIEQRAGNLRPALLGIGEIVAEGTKQRFASATAPDGQPWAKNSDVTLANKNGTLPLTNDGLLADSIHYQLVADNTVEVGSNFVQAAMMQFGGTKSEFPNLWGDIPARPYLGISEAEKAEIMELLGDYLLL
jgi:phage virion morphogenesis protein